MTKKEAIQIILDDKKAYETSLNYAVYYCEYVLSIEEGTQEFDTLVLYVLNNIKYWRHPKAKAVRQALKS